MCAYAKIPSGKRRYVWNEKKSKLQEVIEVEVEKFIDFLNGSICPVCGRFKNDECYSVRIDKKL